MGVVEPWDIVREEKVKKKKKFSSSFICYLIFLLEFDMSNTLMLLFLFLIITLRF